MGAHRHGHSHGFGAPAGFAVRDVARLLRIVAVVCGVLIVLGAVVLWPDGRGTSADPLGLAADPLDAHVVAVEERSCVADPAQTCEVATFVLSEGDDEGATATMDLATDSGVEVGDDIQVLAVERVDGSTAFSFYEFQRSTPLIVLVVVFVAAVLALGRWRGSGR